MSNPVFRGWPSVADLLESPPLRALAARVQPQKLAAEVGLVLQRVRAELHAATADAPAPVDLAARVARWIAASEAPATRPSINATGAVFPGGLGSPPLSEQAASRLAAARQNHMVLSTGQRAATLAAKLAGAESATLFSTVAGGLATALASLASDGAVLVARGHVVDIDGVPLPELARCAHASLREIGSANHASAAQWEAAATRSRPADPEAKLMLGVSPSTFRIRPPYVFPDWETLGALARRLGLPLVIDLGLGGLTPTAIAGLEGLTSAREALQAGADLCLARGDKMIGGPSCGVALGSAQLIARLDAHPLRAAWRLDDATQAALEATLEPSDSASGELAVEPLAVRLLRVSAENLRNRAQRLAPQLSAIPGIAAAEARASTASLSSPGDGWDLPGWSVFIQPRSGTALALLQRLAAATPAIVGRLADDWVELNLRSVPPSQDVELLATLEQSGLPS
jgi:L-seryl-tRNA(Ser) seleniumtransferase